MASKLSGKQSAENMKQKSLMSFFGKATAQNTTTPNPKAKAKAFTASVKKGEETAASSSDVDVFQTPMSKGVSHSSSLTVVSAKFSRSSDGGSVAETPPTSDPIDVDMVSAEETEGAKGAEKKKPVRRP